LQADVAITGAGEPENQLDLPSIERSNTQRRPSLSRTTRDSRSGLRISPIEDRS
jgi:hypothetical protein